METNYKQVQKIFLITLLANVAVAVSKLVIGTLINSASMAADGFHSFSDGSSNIVCMIGIYFAAKPRDDKHPYGHHKIETLSGIAIGLLLVAAAAKVVIGAIDKFQHPSPPQITSLSLVVLLITLAVNIFVTTYERRQGIKLNSSILIADAAHTKSDIFVTVGVLATLIALKFGLPPILDPIVSLVVAVVILLTAWEILRDNANVLLDAASVDMDFIRAEVMRVPGVKGVHDIRSRGLSSQVEIDMHVLVDPDMSVEEGHIIQHDIEEILQDAIDASTKVLIHLEPYTKDQAEKQ